VNEKIADPSIDLNAGSSIQNLIPLLINYHSMKMSVEIDQFSYVKKLAMLTQLYLELRLPLQNALRAAEADLSARVQLAIARRGLVNNAQAILLEAYMDRRQGRFERAIQEFNEAITRDPANTVAITELAHTFYNMRQFHAAEQAFERLIELLPEQL
jgi:Flp pilus assembly protein TadD